MGGISITYEHSYQEGCGQAGGPRHRQPASLLIRAA